MLIDPMDYVVRIIVLPSSIRAFTSIDEDGRANIYINCTLSRPRQEKSFWHELHHLKHNDFWNDLSIVYIESA